MTREDDRYNAAFMAHEDINDWFQPYTEFFFMDDKTHEQVAPAALFKDSNPLDPTGAGDYYVNCSNPLLSAQQQGILCTPAQIAADTANPGAATAQVRIGRRNIEGGDRFIDFEHTNYRAVFGSKGSFAEAWSYDLYGQYFYTAFSDSNQKYLSYESITNALLVTGTAANPTCISGSNRGCVPYNIFTDGGVTQAALNYLYLLGTATGSATLRTLHADVTGKLGDYGITSPLATEGIGVNVGFEHRNDHELLQPDAAEESQLLSGFGSAVAPIDAGLSVAEEFIELRAPLMQDKAGAKELLFDTGYRRSDYSTAGVTNTYKFEVQYAPIADYRFRASYDRAIRAPSVAELFTPPIVGLTTVVPDPCAPPISFTLASVRAHRRDGRPVQQRLDPAGYGQPVVAGNQRQSGPETGAGRYLYHRLEFCPEPDCASHRQHRLLPHSGEGRNRRDSVPGRPFRLRQHRRSNLLQPDRALTEHRQFDRQQHRIRRLCHSEELQPGNGDQ